MAVSVFGQQQAELLGHIRCHVGESMQQSQEMTSGEKEALKDVVDESVGITPDKSAEIQAESDAEPELPEFAKKKLGMQQKRHKKEMRQLQSQIDDLRSHMGSRPEPTNSPEQPMNAYSSQPQGGMDDQIQRAVAMALRAKEDQERKVKDAEKMQHVHKQYQALQDHLDNASNQYDDFDEVVRSPDAPFTETMRDTALLIPNPGEVFYKLGKNRDELKRISSLHPLDQAKEIVKMSVAMMSSTGNKGQSAVKTIGQIKNSPVTNASGAVNENTSVGELRKRMKDGWK